MRQSDFESFDIRDWDSTSVPQSPGDSDKAAGVSGTNFKGKAHRSSKKKKKTVKIDVVRIEPVFTVPLPMDNSKLQSCHTIEE